MAPKNQNKAQQQKAQAQDQVPDQVQDQQQTQIEETINQTQATSPKSKKTNNSKNTKSDGERSTTPQRNTKKATPVTTDTEEKDTVSQSPSDKKLSAVPMPLVKRVKEHLGGDVALKNMSELKTILESFIQVIVDSTMKGDSVTLPNYMTFKRVLRNERTHMNPKTKEKIVKPAHYVLSMYVKAQLKKEFEDIPVNEEDMQKALNKPAKKTAVENPQEEQ